ncbi:hypothetical protein [Actinokineospora sp. NBRC 105648]|uniref:hypothetical protein n=1 Tax=Actinokineospora sp. NBRC 105648 TaxID=3032206 RepID=UPI0024A1904C|nr:hypothetical protein [Actinokineospora sp. NBRC 105648]GLZ40744.1 hypothetical protein Acsp05_43680 [Actinokineospora sp. NBRC 105648]
MSTSARADEPDNAIGIKLLEAPVSRRDDPRAQNYIVDHLAPGAVIKRAVQITNSSSTVRRIEVFPGAARVTDNAFELMPGRAVNELTNWISVDKGQLDLDPGKSARVLVTIRVDPIAAPGERFAVVWAQTSAPFDGADAVLLTSRVGIRTYLDVGAGGEPASDFAVSGLTPVRGQDGRPQVLATVHNTGGRAVDLAGDMALSDGPGSLSAGPFPATLGTTLLPDGTAAVQIMLDSRLPDGPWTARLTLRSGALERTVTATITFPSAAGATGATVAPDTWFDRNRPLLIGLAIAVLLLLAVLVYLLVRRRKSDRHPPRVADLEPLGRS